MIYDSFLFFNELDLLELRLNELDSVVDKFILLEANKTFTGKPKPFYFEQNKQRFEKFLPKIIHIPLNCFYQSFTNWQMEQHQRNMIALAWYGLKENDIVLLSDIDEIPRAKLVDAFKSAFLTYKPIVFEQNFFYYYLNGKKQHKWRGTIGTSYKQIKDNNWTPSDLRKMATNYNYNQWIIDGGWHFSFLGGADKIREKIEAFSHQEYNKPKYKDLQNIYRNIYAGKDIFNRRKENIKYIPIDESFPKYVYENQERWQEFIKEV